LEIGFGVRVIKDGPVDCWKWQEVWWLVGVAGGVGAAS